MFHQINYPAFFLSFVLVFLQTNLFVKGQDASESISSYFSNIQASYSGVEKSFKVSGQTRYPDETRLQIAIGYQGERILIIRESVANGRFEAKIPATKKVLPTCYDIEIIFWPQRQPASLAKQLQKLPEEIIFVPVFTDTPNQVRQEWQKNLEFLKKTLTESKEWYNTLRTDYLNEKTKQPQDFNLNNWEQKSLPKLDVFNKAKQIIAQRQETYLSDIFPEVNNLMLSFIQEINRIYEELTEDLRKGGVIDVHTGQKMKTESIINKADTMFRSYYESLQTTVQLKEQIGDENVLINYFRRLEHNYQVLLNNYRNGLNQKITTDQWDALTATWSNKIIELKAALDKDESQIAAPTKELTDFYQTFKKLTEDVIKLSELCGKHIKHQERDETKLAGEIQQKQNQFQKDFYSLLTWLGFQRLYVGKLSRPEIPSVDIPLTITDETRALIQKQIQLIKTTSEKAERETALMELTSIGPAVAPYLKQELAGNNKTIIAVFLKGLCFFGSEVAPLKTQLLEFLKSDNQDLKLQAIEALKYVNEESVVDALLALLKDKNQAVRLRSIQSLGYLKKPRAMDELMELLSDKDLPVREKTIDALRQMTQMQLEFTPDAPEDLRKLQIDKIKKWWLQNKSKYLKPAEKR